MRRPTDVRPDLPRGRPSASRAWVGVAVAVAFFLITSGRGVARFFTDYLWFKEVGYTSVWSGVLTAKLGLSVGFTLAFFVLLLVNLLIADRLAPTFRPMGTEDEVVARYQEAIGPHAGKVRLAVAALFALIAGTGAGSEWKSWLLFRNSVPFGRDDPLFGRDISFFVFRLPFLSYLVDWLFVAFVLVLVLTAVAHYLNGGIRLQSPLQRVTPQVKAHLSVLLGLVFLAKAAGYYVQRFELSFSTNGYVDGAGYTDVNARMPALQLLMLIMIAAFGLFIVNIWRRGWALPVVALLVWAVVALLAGVISPAFIQSVRVRPNENAREREFIERNIKATRAAMGIDAVENVPFEYDSQMTASDLEANATTVRNIRLWDPNTLKNTYQRLQELRPYYQFEDVDIDRYEIDGEVRSVVLSVRGLNPAEIPGDSWVNTHLQYTHGYGAVLSSANAIDGKGRPDLLVRDIPPEGLPELALDEPRVYFSEDLPGYAVVRTKQEEIDYQTATGETKTSTYPLGAAGVELSSAARRFAFFLRFADPNILLSSQLTDESRIIFKRDIAERVRAAAPFLSFDADPYPVVSNGDILWIQDAYTTTSRYPYGQRVDTSGLAAGADLRGQRFNYVRNSVKIVTNAFTGEMRFFLWQPDTDPIVRSYAKAFPDLFEPAAAMPAELRSHLRYPEDLFRVQATMFGEYHVTNPSTFYAETDDWDIAQDPGTGRVSDQLRTDETTATTSQGAPALVFNNRSLARIEPTYLLLKLPGDDSVSFVILQPFVPQSRGDRQINLTAFLAASSDPESYGRLRTFEMPRDEQIDGPLIVNNAIQSDPDISRELSLLDGRGSKALLGQVQVIPIENSLLYVRPLYVTSEQTDLPEVKRVIVVHEGRAVMRATLR
ncbi:MAG TPA: UPF0182 family protein, partial [Acidimicrobiales bacterium]